MSSTQSSKPGMRCGPQSCEHGMARGSTQTQEPKHQVPNTGSPQKWQVDQAALHINFLARILYEEMVKYNDILQSYYNSLLLEENQSQHLERVIHDLQNQVADAEIRRITAEGRMQTLQVDYTRLAALYDQSSSVIPDASIFDYESDSFSPTQQLIQEIQPGNKRKADFHATACPMPKRTQGMAGTSLVAPTAITPLKIEDMI